MTPLDRLILFIVGALLLAPLLTLVTISGRRSYPSWVEPAVLWAFIPALAGGVMLIASVATGS
jgi:uncharacterized membrane protein YdcZ (DUF606 family)